jgi:hypothetical protein
MHAFGLAVCFVRAASGADRCSLVVARDEGSDLYGTDDGGDEERRLSVVPRQLFDHFDRSPAAEVHRDLADSPFESDRSLAKKGYAEVIRAPLRGPDGRTTGILNAIRRSPGSGERERLLVERMAAALSVLADASATVALGRRP